MPVRDFYQGKNVLITGTTGFLGKVVLEKFLRTIPDVGKIFILIRKKRGSLTMERFKKEVIASPCFDEVRKSRPDFNEFISSKIVPIEGDLLKEGLDMSPENFKLVTENVNVIINSAASVDFNSRLDEAIKINVRGTLRMFELAKACKNLVHFLHVSTCYVNCDQKSGSFLDEKIYEADYDPEEKLKELEQLSVETIVKDIKKLLGTYPNTYTFTKALCERLLLKRKGDVPVTILRPSIIGAAAKQPVPGWIDTISAAGALYFMAGLGILHEVQGNLNNVGDQIPVDYVSDAIIVAAAAFAGSKNINVIHSASSTKNPLKWSLAKKIVIPYFNENPSEKRVGKSHFTMFENPKVLKGVQVARRIPVHAFNGVAKVVRSPAMIKKAGLLKRVVERSESVAKSFSHFTANEWFFATDNASIMQQFCSPEEQKIFQLDITALEWENYLEYFCWGLKTFILKEKVEPPSEAKHMNLLEKQGEYLAEVQWALTKGQNFYPRPNAEMKSIILGSNRVQNAITKLVKERKDTKITEEDYFKRLQHQAENICEAMFAKYSMPVIRFMAWSMNKFLKTIYEKIVIDETSLEMFKTYDQKQSGPLVLLPTHRSYIDFLLVSYIFFSHGLKVPHMAAAEEFLSVRFLRRLLRASGAFFIKRKEIGSMELYKAILYEYVQKLLMDESWIEFFIEGSRSRAGKMLAPKFDILNIVADTYFDQKLPDVQFVPVTLNYEKVIEAESFPFELLGEAKLQESLRRVVKSAYLLRQNFGRIYIEFNEPISLKTYTEKYGANRGKTNAIKPDTQEMQLSKKEFDPFVNVSHRQELVTELAADIIDIMQKRQVIMATNVVASVLLMHRKGIKEDALVSKVEWIAKEINKRGIKVEAINSQNPSVAVKMALNHLEDLLNKKKDMFHPSVSAKSDYSNVLILSYYRNSLLSVFFNEALITCSLAAFGFDVASKEGIAIERVLEETLYLQKLLGDEVVLKNRITKENFQDLVNLMIQRGILEYNGDKIKVNEKTGGEFVKYFCSLLWPFVESYWVTVVFLFSLRSRKTPPTIDAFLQECQWFAETMYEERLLEYFESCSLDTIKNAFKVFKDWGIVAIEAISVEGKKVLEDHVILSVTEERLLEYESHIKKFMKYSYATSVRSPIERARSTMLVDFPFMAKL